MRKTPLFTGVGTALITPMNASGVDFDALDRLVDFQIEGGVSAIIACGTTGESATLTDEERFAVIGRVIRRAAGRVPVIAGTGSNDTAHAVAATKRACDLGADGCLVVTPYYNKTSQSGLVASFTAIADASSRPILLYNVPSRTGINIEPATYALLADHPRIAGVKEANGDISKIVDTARLVRGKMDLYSGNDDQIVPILAVGGVGVVSVLSNLLPRLTADICARFFAGDLAGSMELQCRCLPLIRALFSQTNPIPVKAAMARMGFGEDVVRLPLIPLEEPHRARLYREMEAFGL